MQSKFFDKNRSITILKRNLILTIVLTLWSCVPGSSQSEKEVESEVMIFNAIRANDSKALKSALKIKSQINKPILLADYKKYVPFLENIPIEKTTPLLYLLGKTLLRRGGVGINPLYSSPTGNPKILEILLQAGANPNVEDENGGTPLIYSVWLHTPSTTKSLLKYGAKINYQNSSGMTALMVAINVHNREKNLHIVEELLKAKPDLHKLKNSRGESAYQLAVSSKNDSLIKLMHKYEK